MNDPSTEPHWILGVTRRAGLRGVDGLEIPTTTALTHAWSLTAEAAGIDQPELAARLAAILGITVADFSDAEPQASKILPEELARRFTVVPVEVTDRTLTVATAEPLNVDAEEEIRFASGRAVEFQLATPMSILAKLDESYPRGRVEKYVLTNQALAKAGRAVRFEEEHLWTPADETRHGGVTKLAKVLFMEAGRAGAEDVRIELERTGGEVRFRVGGEVAPFMYLPRSSVVQVVEWMAEIAGIGSMDHRHVRQGFMDIRIDGALYEVKMSIVPAREGDKVVMQLQRKADDGSESPEVLTARERTIREVEKALGFKGQAAPTAMKGLVVDDDDSARMLVRVVLEKMGVQVVEAVHGLEAVELLTKDKTISLMILDLNMPVLDGVATLERVRADIHTAGLPIIIMTASEDTESEMRLLEAGADDYFRKPLDLSRFAQRIQGVMRRSGTYRTTRRW